MQKGDFLSNELKEGKAFYIFCRKSVKSFSHFTPYNMSHCQKY